MRPSPKPFIIVLLLGTTPSHAQELQGFDVNALPMPVAQSPFAGVRGAERSELGTLHWSARCSLLLAPLSVTYPSPSPEGVQSAVIDGAMMFELGMNIGIGLGFEAGLRMGATLTQWGPGMSVASGTTDNIASFGSADPLLELGWTADLHPLSLRPYVALQMPWGRVDAFSGDPTARAQGGVAAAGNFWRITWGAEVGFIYRPPLEISGSSWGSQLHLGGGMLYHLTESLLLGPELHIMPVLTSQAHRSGANTGIMLPAEALLTSRYEATTWNVAGSFGSGLPLTSTGTNETSLTRGPTSPLLRFLIQFGMDLSR